MSDQAETPFDSIEGSHEYVALLADAIEEARRDVESEIAAAERDAADRRKEALLLVSYNLAKLNLHITTSRRILNDLRTLRRLLLAERGLAMEAEDTGVSTRRGLSAPTRFSDRNRRKKYHLLEVYFTPCLFTSCFLQLLWFPYFYAHSGEKPHLMRLFASLPS